jgi:hypothetical protein
MLWKLKPTVNGMPDRVLIAPNGHVVWIEFKAAEGRLRPEQRAMLDRLHDLGHEACVVRSVEVFDAILDSLVGLL